MTTLDITAIAAIIAGLIAVAEIRCIRKDRRRKAISKRLDDAIRGNERHKLIVVQPMRKAA